MMRNRCLVFICLLQVMIFSTSHAQTVLPDEISIVVHQNAITNMIKAALPLTLENGSHLKGNLWIQAIDHLKIEADKVMFDINIRGKNMKFETQLGKKSLLLDVGNVNAFFNCTASFRYDAAKRILFITPYFLQDPKATQSDQMGNTLLQLLSLGNGVEYPVEIQKIQPIVTKISNDQFNIGMHITRIYTEKDRIYVCGQAKLEKVKQP